MAKSFFEKLTGASTEEEAELPTEEKKEPAATPTKSRKRADKRIIKKDSLDMPQPETDRSKAEKTSMKKPAKKAEPEKEKPIEDKNWLEEAEGEEGQLTIDVYQTNSDVVIKSTIAGVEPENIDISITNDMVTIRGKREKDEKIETENYYYQELYWGAFSRSVILPVEVEADRAKATIKNGILTIKLPKSEKIKTKKIQVKALE